MATAMEAGGVVEMIVVQAVQVDVKVCVVVYTVV